LAGWLASVLVRGAGLGLVGDLLVGLESRMSRATRR